jgi:hypothetical protein
MTDEEKERLAITLEEYEPEIAQKMYDEQVAKAENEQ